MKKLIRGLLGLLYLFIILILVYSTNYEYLNREAIAMTGDVTYNEYISYNYGLGNKITIAVENNRSYNWYFDQGFSGKWSENNCGPAVATMAIKWNNESFKEEVIDARYKIKETGEWWSTNDIKEYLREYNVSYKETLITQHDGLIEMIENGSIGILCIDPRVLPYNNKKEDRTGLFYKPGEGHFIIVKGYKIVDDKLYYQCYDPASWGVKYSDGTLKGVDRYYLSTDLYKAMEKRWNGVILVK